MITWRPRRHQRPPTLYQRQVVAVPVPDLDAVVDRCDRSASSATSLAVDRVIGHDAEVHVDAAAGVGDAEPW